MSIDSYEKISSSKVKREIKVIKKPCKYRKYTGSMNTVWCLDTLNFLMLMNKK